MADPSVLDVRLYGQAIGTLTRFADDRSLLSFDPAYIDDRARPTLSLSFKDTYGELIADQPPTRTRLGPFFANLLPEGAMRDYLAKRARVSARREFFLLWMLGQDLPGAVTIQPADGRSMPPADDDRVRSGAGRGSDRPLRFSLAGVQLKFSAVAEASGGLTIPVDGEGGSWIVKLPSARFEGVPENEHAMMCLAREIGIDVPPTRLVPVADIAGLPEGIGALGKTAYVIERFDRTPAGPLHIEDFAQVFGVYPEAKYERASYRNIAQVIWTEAGQPAIAEFVRRLVFAILIGNADMHLKNWSLIYPDRRYAALAPAYDLVSTIAYLPDDALALKVSRTKRFAEIDIEEFIHLAAKAALPEKLVIDTARQTVERFHAAWHKRKSDLGLPRAAVQRLQQHIERVPLS